MSVSAYYVQQQILLTEELVQSWHRNQVYIVLIRGPFEKFVETDLISHPYSTTGKITALYILISKFFI